MEFIHHYALQNSFSVPALKRTAELLESGNTIPFLARYRKEVTGGMDEVQLESFRDAHDAYRKLSQRLDSILKNLQESGQLNATLEAQLKACSDIQQLEDVYLPYKPKRKTRASMAREKGLQPLADIILRQQEKKLNIAAQRFINKEVTSVEEAIQGAVDIIAEKINEDRNSRELCREAYRKFGILQAKVKKSEAENASNFKDYFDFSQSLIRVPAHRIHAILRGAEEGFLKISLQPDIEKLIGKVEGLHIRPQGECKMEMMAAVEDAYKRLLHPSIENEVLAEAKQKADEEAVKIFAANLQQLLMAAPIGQKRTLAIDPGFRTGCKVVCLNEEGKLEYNENIYPHQPQNQEKQAMSKLSSLIERYKIEVVAIGNGTAGRETEQLVQRMRLPAELRVYVVSENGASVYSASPVARKEFPDYDVTVRGAVSIGRRLQDPLSELVKIDPKSVGVGQYQHDVDQNMLSMRLDDVVIRCVNQVGVNLNTASASVLKYIAGLGPSLADAIVAYRNEKGAFESRSDLNKVPRLGPKAFEQCAGFLRILDGKEVLDSTSIHPERYALVNKMARELGIRVNELIGNKTYIAKIEASRFVDSETGMQTISDILKELEKPAADPRRRTEMVEFDKRVKKLEDLEEGMVLPGIITNITAFGAFVDVGVKQDGLVHISELANRFVKDPMEVVKLHQAVRVKVISVDAERKRVAFSIKQAD